MNKKLAITLTVLVLGIVSTVFGITTNPVQKLGADPACMRKDQIIDRTFYFDEKVVQRVVPDYTDCTVTIHLKDGKSKTYPFDWIDKKSMEDKAKAEFINK